MSVFLRHEPCPRCGSRDNVGRYSDGSAYCFGCKWRDRGDVFIPQVEYTCISIQLDDDLCSDFPGHVVGWLAKYDISVQEAIKHGWKYSPGRDQLVFIFRDETGQVELTQARNFSPASKLKYFTQGQRNSILPIFHTEVRPLVRGTRLLVLVEDIISAAKIARQCDAMPCLGCTIPKAKLKALRLFYDVLVVWLDANKLNEARDIASQAKWLGFKTHVVFTERDPKEYTNSEIKENLLC